LKGKVKKPLRTEHDEQSILIAWCRASEEMQSDPIRRRALRWTYATPNGFHRGPQARMKAMREGVKSGILDLTVPAPELRSGIRNSGGYHGLYIEMKRKGEVARPTQIEFMDYLDLVHYRQALCYHWTDAGRIIAEHLDLDSHFPLEEDRVEELLAEAKRLWAIDRPPKERTTPRRRARPRGKAKR
jgi:hypothetical protein